MLLSDKAEWYFYKKSVLSDKCINGGFAMNNFCCIGDSINFIKQYMLLPFHSVLEHCNARSSIDIFSYLLLTLQDCV